MKWLKTQKEEGIHLKAGEGANGNTGTGSQEYILRRSPRPWFYCGGVVQRPKSRSRADGPEHSMSYAG